MSMEALSRGALLKTVLELPVRESIARMRYVEEKNMQILDALLKEMSDQIGEVMPEGGETDVA